MVEPLFGGRDALSAEVYEAVRDAAERNGRTCPDDHFAATDKGYPLDDDKCPYCPECGAPMTIEASGDLSHPAPACTATR